MDDTDGVWFSAALLMFFAVAVRIGRRNVVMRQIVISRLR